jgi:hypothetical protein
MICLKFCREEKKVNYLQGARWDINTGSIADSRLKELHPNMPVMFIKALTQVQ